MSVSSTISLSKLLDKDLVIPYYQRPYEWNKNNVYVLLNDIYNSYSNNKDINLGSIILFKNSKGDFEVVDGQQRLITLSLTFKYFPFINEEVGLLNKELLCISDTEKRIINNYNSITVFLERLEKYEGLNIQSFAKYLRDRVFFYVLYAKDMNEAFQLFDGRNSKYKDLTPVDLLKAYHLGELPKNFSKEEKRNILEKWNNNINDKFDIDDSCNKIDYLYNNVLFNIYNWSLNKYTYDFSKNDIYLYKGYSYNSESKHYPYVKYYDNNNLFQINKPFKAGKGFFDMTSDYIERLDKYIKKYDLASKIDAAGLYAYNLKLIYNLYYCSLFAFFDRFGEDVKGLYSAAIEEYIFKYSLLLRVKNKQVNRFSLNYYVLNSSSNFFYECNNSLKVEELLKLELDDIGNRPNKNEKLGKLRNDLWKKLNQ